MTNSTASEHCPKIRDLIIPYLEDLLTVEERSEFEEHLSGCQDCADELGEKKRWSSMLGANREALCPEPWELYEYTRDAKRESDSLQIHLEHCTSCNEQYETFLESTSEQSMPEALWERMTGVPETREVFPQPHFSLSEWLGDIVNRVQDFFTAPALAFGTVAAVVLLIVVLYPHGSSQPVALLSSEDWRSVVIKRGLMSSGAPSTEQGGSKLEKKRIAELIIFKNEGSRPQQAWIDGLYGELEPSEESAEMFDWVTPAEISKALAGKKLDANDGKAMVEELRSALDVTDAVLITIESGKADRTYDVKVELVNAETGSVLKEHRLTGMTRKRLGERTKEAIDSLLKVD
jgi:Putative zinc-finger